MIIKQLSVFLENKAGRINEVMTILGNAGINLSAFSMAENEDLGILRVIVSDPEKALAVLKENQFGVTLTDVVCLRCPDTPGALAKALNYLADANIFIEYMYAFSSGDSANVVIRSSDINACIEVLHQHKLELIGANRFYKI